MHARTRCGHRGGKVSTARLGQPTARACARHGYPSCATRRARREPLAMTLQPPGRRYMERGVCESERQRAYVLAAMITLWTHYKPTSLVYGSYTGEGSRSYTGAVLEIFLIRAPCTTPHPYTIRRRDSWVCSALEQGGSLGPRGERASMRRRLAPATSANEMKVRPKRIGYPGRT